MKKELERFKSKLNDVGRHKSKGRNSVVSRNYRTAHASRLSDSLNITSMRSSLVLSKCCSEDERDSDMKTNLTTDAKFHTEMPYRDKSM